MTQISFPGLGIGPFSLNPVAFTLFGKDVYWYGIIIAAGFLIAVAVCMQLAKKSKSISPDNILDIVLIGLPVAIVCARLYYVAFNFSSYRENPADIFKIWKGGMAIYGGLIGAALSTFLYCKKKRLSLGDTFDICSVGLVIGQAIGRWGNFVNAEAYGGATALPWRMRILEPDWIQAIEVHPTFLYESLWNAAVLVVLLFLLKRKKASGQVFLTYVAAYGAGRFWIEGLRADSLYLGPVRISQVVALISAVVAILAMLFLLHDQKRETQRLALAGASTSAAPEEMEGAPHKEAPEPDGGQSETDGGQPGTEDGRPEADGGEN